MNWLKDEWDDFWYKYSDERQELARHRLRVHAMLFKRRS